MIIKRALDVTLSLAAIVMLFPILFMIACLVYFKLGYPILFIQERVGKDEKVFKMLKFRTMLNLRDKSGKLLSDKERLTSFGRFIRNTSLDELPELINVLKGDMSLVGPRPLLVEYLSLYNEKQKKRHSVLPGITGWAQVNGRNAISWSNKFFFDTWYIENWSLWLDIKIIFITVYKVIRHHGINQQGEITVERFNGFN